MITYLPLLSRKKPPFPVMIHTGPTWVIKIITHAHDMSDSTRLGHFLKQDPHATLKPRGVSVLGCRNRRSPKARFEKKNCASCWGWDSYRDLPGGWKTVAINDPPSRQCQPHLGPCLSLFTHSGYRPHLYRLFLSALTEWCMDGQDFLRDQV